MQVYPRIRRATTGLQVGVLLTRLVASEAKRLLCIIFNCILEEKMCKSLASLTRIFSDCARIWKMGGTKSKSLSLHHVRQALSSQSSPFGCHRAQWSIQKIYSVWKNPINRKKRSATTKKMPLVVIVRHGLNIKQILRRREDNYVAKVVRMWGWLLMLANTMGGWKNNRQLTGKHSHITAWECRSCFDTRMNLLPAL